MPRRINPPTSNPSDPVEGRGWQDVTEIHTVNVTRYKDGGWSASHSRVDMATRQSISTQLPEPSPDKDCQHKAACALLGAAEDWWVEEHGQGMLR